MHKVVVDTSIVTVVCCFPFPPSYYLAICRTPPSLGDHPRKKRKRIFAGYDSWKKTQNLGDGESRREVEREGQQGVEKYGLVL